jgi:hypothetical protein
MSDTENAPVAAESAPTSLSQHAAAGLLANIFDEPETEAPEAEASEPSSDEPAAEAEAATEETAETGQEPEDATPAEEAEPEVTPEDDEFVHGNAKTRLRNGDPIAVADLKKSHGELQEFKARAAQIEAQERQVREHAQRLAQQEQLFNQVLPVAQQLLQQKLPQPPDPKLATEDPIEHYQQMVRYQAEMGQFQQLQYAQKAQLAQAEQARQAQQQQHLAEQAVKLRELMPELQKPERQKEFTADYGKYGTEVYGFTPEELKNVTDARIMPIIRDAIAYRKHLDKQASLKPIVQAKAKAAVPVAAPVKRTAVPDAQSKAYEEGIQRLRSTGSRDMAARLLAELD